MRVTENMKYNSSLGSLFTIQSQYNSLQEKMATQKRINRPSDDPVGITQVLQIRTQQAAASQYQTNVSTCESWITMTESKLSAANDLLVNVRELALSQATGTASADTRKIIASQVAGLKEELLAIANSRLGDRYLFSGSSNVEPFSSTKMDAEIGEAYGATGNGFDGTVTAGGTYTGEQNRTYVLKVTAGGALDEVTYAVSNDGGKTWGAEQTGLGTSIEVGDGVTLSFTAGTKEMEQDDIFYVTAHVAGYYRGNDQRLALTIGPGVSLNYSITGGEVFTAQGSGNVDIFQVLTDLESALSSNDIGGIEEALDGIDEARNQVNLGISRCGTMGNRLDIAKANMDGLSMNLSTSLSNVEDADMIELATKYAMKQVALQACYTMAGKLNEMTILDYLK